MSACPVLRAAYKAVQAAHAQRQFRNGQRKTHRCGYQQGEIILRVEASLARTRSEAGGEDSSPHDGVHASIFSCSCKTDHWRLGVRRRHHSHAQHIRSPRSRGRQLLHFVYNSTSPVPLFPIGAPLSVTLHCVEVAQPVPQD